MIGIVNSTTDATIIVSFVVGAFGMWQIIYSKRSETRLMEYQQKVHLDNATDHNGTVEKIDTLIAKQAELHTAQKEIHGDVREIRTDVRALTEASRQHDKRIDDLEDR